MVTLSIDKTLKNKMLIGFGYMEQMTEHGWLKRILDWKLITNRKRNTGWPRKKLKTYKLSRYCDQRKSGWEDLWGFVF